MFSLLIEIALRGKCRPILLALSRHKNYEIVCGALNNEICPVEALENHSDNEDFLIRLAVAYQEQTPQYILEILLNDKNPEVGAAARVNLRDRDKSIVEGDNWPEESVWDDEE